MCGRFALKTPVASLKAKLQFDNTPDELKSRYNIAPTQQILVVRMEGGRRVAEMMHWGLIPSWSKDPAIGSRMINARSETLSDKPSYKSAFRHRRCLIPADGFYEWAKQDGRKQPYYIRDADDEVMAFAGLWETWQSPEGKEIRSCTIITTDAEGEIASIHNRMPVILKSEQYDTWLNPKTDSSIMQKLLASAKGDGLGSHKVSTRVNKPENDGPEYLL